MPDLEVPQTASREPRRNMIYDMILPFLVTMQFESLFVIETFIFIYCYQGETRLFGTA